MNPLCTPEHAERLKALHDRDPTFGVIGHLWATRVAQYIVESDSKSLLDYGCGRSNLVPAVVCELHRVNISLPHRHEYDPAFGHMPPEPADFVTCIDVLEHVESDLIHDVLQDLHRCMLKMALITVSLRNSSGKKRALHPNVWPRETWLERIQYMVGKVEEIEILDPIKAASEVAMIVRPYDWK